jgi:UDPglucose 6-dehydrogenase
MKVTVIGSGYVGLVTGACLANVGHKVCCMDADEAKIALLKRGKIPIYEPGLEELISQTAAKGDLEFSNSIDHACNFGEVIFIAVGTPPREDGSADLKHVLDVARSIGRHMRQDKLVITKSTVPVGTTARVLDSIRGQLAARQSSLTPRVASNPEFLKEGSAVSDFMRPDRIVIGTDSEQVRATFRELYAPFNRNSDRMLFMDIPSAELCKYAANTMLATKISLINEIANLAEHLGADMEQVRQGIGSDPRIGYHFIYAGCGYGGSCLPKDVRALQRSARDHGCSMQILNAVQATNERQKHKLFNLINQHFGGHIKGLTLALWGLAFKPKTDDMREAPSRPLMEALWQAGARVKAYDPEAMAVARALYPDSHRLQLCDSRDEALQGADALVICTEWQSFRVPDFELMRSHLREPLIFDGRNLYDPALMRSKGFQYYGIGRGASLRREDDLALAGELSLKAG